MKQSTTETAISEIIARLTRLEKVVFGKKQKQVATPREEKFTGPTGGVRFLVSQGTFKRKVGLAEVRAALTKHDYHYSKQAVHEALKRLSGKGGPLVALTESGKRFYVKRK